MSPVAHRAEDVRALPAGPQARMRHRGPRRVAQLGQAGQLDEAATARPDRAVPDGIDLVGLHTQQRGQLAAQVVGHGRSDLDAHHLAEAPPAQLVLDGLQQVGGLVGHLEVGVARHAKDVVVDDLDSREQESRWWAIRSSSAMNVVESPRATKRGRISVGTLTRAKTVCFEAGSRTRTARLSDRLEI